MSKEISQIQFRVSLSGTGIVQRDQTEQKWLYKDSTGVGNLGRLDTNNISFAKANYYYNPDYIPDDKSSKPYIRKIKISNAGLRHAIHVESQPYHTPAVFQNPVIRSLYLSQNDTIIRGYMYADASSQTIKRASAYSIADAEIVNDVVSNIEVRTTTGPRNDTSLFFEESIGKTEYSAVGFIDLDSLSFISLDNRADRLAILPEDKENVLANLIKAFGEDSVETGYYFKKDTADILYENGIVLGNSALNVLVKDLLNKISKINIQSKGHFAQTSKLEIRYIDDPLNQLGEDGWETIFDFSNKINTISDVYFESEKNYISLDFETVKEYLISQEEYSKKLEDVKTAKKEAKKTKKTSETYTDLEG